MPAYKLSRPISVFGMGALVVAFLFGAVQPTRAADDSQHETFSAHLKGAHAMPATNTDATGELMITPRSNEDVLEYRLTMKKAMYVKTVQLRCGEMGKAGPVVATLYAPSRATHLNGTPVMNSLSSSDIMKNMEECNPGIQTMSHLIQAMREGKIYVDVRTTQYPNGFVRGQLGRTQQQGGGAMNMVQSHVPSSATQMVTANASTRTSGTHILLSDYYVLPPDTFTVHGYRFWPNEYVRLTVRGQTVTARADQHGHFATQGIHIPLSAANTDVTVHARGVSSNLTSSAVVKVGTYYPVVTPSSWMVRGGEEVTFRGRYFGPNEDVQLLSDGVYMVTTKSDAHGGMFHEFHVPQDPGTYTYTFKGMQSGASHQVKVKVE